MIDTVWVLIGSKTYYDYSVIIGVFTTAAGAETEKAEWLKQDGAHIYTEFDTYEIKEWALNKPIHYLKDVFDVRS